MAEAVGQVADRRRRRAVPLAHGPPVQQVAHERLRADEELVGQDVARAGLEPTLDQQGAEAALHLGADLEVVLEQHRLAVEGEAVLGTGFERRDRLVDDLGEADAEVLERQVPLAIPVRVRNDPEVPRARVQERGLERGRGHDRGSLGRARDCVSVRLLAFSDVHRDLRQAGRLADRAGEVDAVVAAGDFASVHRGLEELIDMLAVIETPTVLVPGNNETVDALRSACEGWPAARVLHGEGTEIGGVSFFGLGGGVPVTPWDWSFDLSEEEAADRLAACPPGGVLVVHSPPKGCVDGARRLGSEAILAAIEEKQPHLVVCGHIHEAAGEEATVGASRVLNVGPAGAVLEL